MRPVRFNLTGLTFARTNTTASGSERVASHVKHAFIVA
jgi:hypothetical protein